MKVISLRKHALEDFCYMFKWDINMISLRKDRIEQREFVKHVAKYFLEYSPTSSFTACRVWSHIEKTYKKLPIGYKIRD